MSGIPTAPAAAPALPSQGEGDARATGARFLFTPFESMTSGIRLELYLSDADKAKVNQRGPRGPGIVADLDSGTVLRVRGVSCGSDGCFCAAEVIEKVSDGHTTPKAFPEE